MDNILGVSVKAYAEDVQISTTSKRAEVNVIKLQTFMQDAETSALTML